MFGRVFVGQPGDALLFVGAVLTNIAAVLAVGAEIAYEAPIRWVVATVVVLLLSFPWTSWAQTNHLERNRQREASARAERIAESARGMKMSLEPDVLPPARAMPRPNTSVADGNDPWSDD